MRKPITVNVNEETFNKIDAICGVNESFRSKQHFLEELIKEYFLRNYQEKILKIPKEEKKSNFMEKYYNGQR